MELLPCIDTSMKWTFSSTTATHVKRVAVGSIHNHAARICNMRAAAPTAPVSTATSNKSASGPALRCPEQRRHTVIELAPPSSSLRSAPPGIELLPFPPRRVPLSSLRDFPPVKQRHPELWRPRFSDGFSSRSRSMAHFW